MIFLNIERDGKCTITRKLKIDAILLPKIMSIPLKTTFAIVERYRIGRKETCYSRLVTYFRTNNVLRQSGAPCSLAERAPCQPECRET